MNCSDGTSVKLVVDANTLTGLTQAVQAMIDYPAGLSCTLIQNPLGVTFGQIASASTGSNPFIVGGGRWQATVLCSDLQLTPPPPPPALVGGSTVARVPGSWSYDPNAYPSSQQTEATTMIWVNIAVNVHQMDGGTGPNGPAWDARTLTTRIRDSYPRTAFAVAWYSSYENGTPYVFALPDVSFTKELLQDPLIVTHR